MGEAESTAATLDVEIGGLGGEVTLVDLFPSSWVETHCDATSIGEFVEESGFEVSDQESFESIPSHKWDRYVDSNTEFDDWQAMLSAGVERYVLERANIAESDADVSAVGTDTIETADSTETAESVDSGDAAEREESAEASV
ncbi:hypothetical protein C440_12016 [Haloferax mucosum ATCC BAA-1512]|uniref:Uncharacterized protein n=1 Tax=Haloferax mucosum ATCC BAA-1512 TaxID=662479 RepID=M0IB13_9EURY|nr:hypothetical protein [Haloferax mucosum]ELZ93023.1 hypothetical protein C440_12016 [Haloferax mucosum ATCC BAA-1512]